VVVFLDFDCGFEDLRCRTIQEHDGEGRGGGTCSGVGSGQDTCSGCSCHDLGTM